MILSRHFPRRFYLALSWLLVVALLGLITISLKHQGLQKDWRTPISSNAGMQNHDWWFAFDLPFLGLTVGHRIEIVDAEMSRKLGLWREFRQMDLDYPVCLCADLHPRPSAAYECLGFGFNTRDDGNRRFWWARVPNYLIFGLLLGPQAIYFLMRHRNRKIPTQCKSCSCDLRAHNPGDKCPECGTEIVKKV